ncbi:MAG: TolC family protein [Alphaproteobacteria bacterium]
MKVIFLFMICFLLLCNCTLGPEFQKPQLYSQEKIQKALDLKPTGQNNYLSYQIFKDKTLNKLIKMAFEESLTVRQAISRIKQSRLQLSIANVQGLPVFDIKGSYQYTKESKNIGYVFDEDIYQIGLDASWELDIFGSARKNAEAQAANVMQTIENLNNVYVSLSAEIALNYIAFRQTQEQIKIVHNQVLLNQKILKENKMLLSSGLATSDVVNQALINLNKYKSDLSTLNNNLLQYKIKLSFLVGKLPDGLDTILSENNDNLITRSVSFNEKELFNLPSTIIEERPDVKAAEYALKAQNAKIGVAMANMFPKISLSGMLGFQALHIDKVFNLNSYAYSYEPMVSIPVFYFGQLKNKLEIEKEGYKEAFLNYENIFLNAASEIKEALNNVAEAFKQYNFIHKQYQQAYNLYNKELERFKAGMTDKISLLSSELNYLTMKKNLVNSNANIYTAVIAFFKSIGAIS